MASTESTPLLPSHDSPPKQASWRESYQFLFFGSYINILLVFVPLSFIAHHLHWDAALRFSFSFLAIIPLAKLLSDCTEQMCTTLGETLAGLLNASFGNAVEIIVGVAALLQDEILLVQTSLIGSILSNLLLVLGCSFLAAGTRRPETLFQATGAQASSSLMTLACITLVIPAAYRFAGRSSDDYGLNVISRGTSIILLVVYVIYVYFQLKTHPNLFRLDGPRNDTRDDMNNTASDSDILVVEEEEPKMNLPASTLGLLIVTVVTSFCADYLVASIEETAERYHIPKPFIGLILLPIVANAAEHVTSITLAMVNKMGATITICVGSSIQIAAFVVPLLVLVGWATGHDLTLFFSNFETIIIFASVILTNTLIQDGRSNYMEGVMLLSLYFVVALAFWVS